MLQGSKRSARTLSRRELQLNQTRRAETPSQPVLQQASVWRSTGSLLDILGLEHINLVHMKLFPATLLTLLSLSLLSPVTQAQQPKPLRILLITGGCCHDYDQQKDILKQGIEKRLNAEVTQIHTSDKTTKPPLAIYGNPEYAKGFDLVIHDECAADINDETVVAGVLKPHQEGLPGVNLHCAMHSYRIGSAKDPATVGTPHAWWFEYLGLQSSAHGPKEPIRISHIDKNDSLSKNLPDWTTVNEELYNNIQVFDSAKAVMRGQQTVKAKDGTEKEMESVVTWTNLYKGKTRVFSTTIGHVNETVADDRYLDLVSRGILWATDHLTADGSAKDGFGK